MLQHVVLLFLAKLLQHVVEWTHRDMQCQRSRFQAISIITYQTDWEALPTLANWPIKRSIRAAQYKDKAQRVITIRQLPSSAQCRLLPCV